MLSSKCIEPRFLWLPSLIHTALLILLAPLAWWVTFGVLVGGVHFHFGTALALFIGIPATYLFFGFSLLVACVAATAVTVWVARLQSAWQRLACGTAAGVAIGSAMGGYIALKLQYDGAGLPPSPVVGKFEEFLPGPIVGMFLGLALSTLWRWSCRLANAVSRRLAEPAAPPNGGPATSLGNSEGLGGPPSVS